jgi:hypothetical protein
VRSMAGYTRDNKVCFPTNVKHVSALHPLSLPPLPYLVLDSAFFYIFPQCNID